MSDSDPYVSPTNYNGLAGVGDEVAFHVGGNMRAGDPYTFTPRVWRYLIDRFGVSSVMDIGSGRAHAGLFFHRQGMQVICVDGLAVNVDTALYPSVLHDLTRGPVRTKVDLVHCQEVVEHVEEAYVDNIIESFLCGEIIVFTHAVPGQGGYHHVNLQPPQYWIEHMRTRGCLLLEEDTRRVRDLAAQDGGIYLAATGLVFENPGIWYSRAWQSAQRQEKTRTPASHPNDRDKANPPVRE